MGLIQKVVYGAAKRWIAGKDMETALERAREANSRGLGVIMNYLGEDVTDPALAESNLEEYLRLQRGIAAAGIDGCVSVKPTQFMLGSDQDAALERVSRLAEGAAAARGQMLWIDMEGSAVTAKTLDLYSRLVGSNKNVGVALQAYLKRSEADLLRLLDLGAKVRLVKGAYREPSGIVYGSREEVSRSYVRLMRLLFERGEGFAVATHDSRLITEAERLHQAAPGTRFEFEMLRGIRDDLKPGLLKRGYRVVDYLPYGAEWYAYSMRRIKEHPSNVWLLLRSI